MQTAAREGIFVGREPELAAVERCLAEGHRGGGSVVLLHGEAGIGKTRMLAASLRAAVSSRYCVATATNIEHARSPFGPWIEALRILGPLVPELIPVARSDRALYERFVGDELLEQPAVDKRRLFVIIANALQRAAATVSLAIGFDDAQWLDPESLELLQFIAPRLERQRAVVLLTILTDDAGGEMVLNSLQRFSTSVAVSMAPFSDDTAREMIVGTSPRRLQREAVDAIVEQAGGNPLFVAELVRDATSEKARRLSPTIALLTQQRLQGLTPAQRRVVEASSAVGMTFRIEHVSDAIGASRMEVIDALRAAHDAGLVLQGADAETFAFRHGTVRKAIYERMLAAERLHVHRSLAESLERASSGAGTTILAHHWLQAGDRERAAALASRAGDEAMVLNAYLSARDRFREALDDGAYTGAVRAEIEMKLGRALDLAGDSLAAMESYRSATAGFNESGVADRELDAKLAFASAAHRAGHGAEMVEACNDVLAETHDTRLCFGARALLAMHYVYRSDLESGQIHLDAAAALSGPRDPRDEVSIRWSRALAAHFRNDESWIEDAKSALQIAERHGDAALLAYTLANLGSISRERGYDAEASESIERALAIADDNGLLYISAYLRSLKVGMLHFSGKLEEAFRLVLETSALHVDAAIARIIGASRGLPILADMDRFDALPLLEDRETLEAAFATDEHGRFAPLSAAHVASAAVRGDLDAIPALIDRALKKTSSSTHILEALLTFARHGENRHALRAAEVSGDLPRAGSSRLCHKMIHAIAVFRSGNRAEGQRQMRTSLNLAERLGAPLHAGTLYEFLGDQSSALQIYRDIGAAGQVRRLTGKSGNLTRREREIADLISKGISNRTIAQQLALSERTIEHHAASIYSKLGNRTRAEFIAAYAQPSGQTR